MTEAPTSPAPAPPLLRRPLRPRFSLRSLLLFVLLAASAFLLWLHWNPWVPAARLEGEPDRDALLAFSPDGERLVGTAGLNVHVWDAATGRLLARRPYHRTRDGAHSDTPAGPLVACTGPDPLVARSETLDQAGVEAMRARLSFKVSFPGGSEGWTNCENALRDVGQRLEAEGIEDVIFAWDARAANDPDSWWPDVSYKLEAKDTPWCEELEQAADAGKLGVRYEEALVVLYPLKLLSEKDPAVESNVRVWDLETGAPVKDLEGLGGRVTQLRFERGGRFLIARTEENAVRVWRTSDWSVLADLKQDFSGIGSGLSVSPNGQRMMGRVPIGSSMRFWKTASTLVSRPLNVGGETSAAVFSPDGSRVFVNVADKGGMLLATDPPAKIAEWKQPSLGYEGNPFANYAAYTFTTDGARLLSLDGAGGPRVRSAETGELLPLPPEASGMVSGERPAFTPDGLRILTRSLEDGVLRVWDLRDYRELAVLPKYTENPDRDRLFGLLGMEIEPPKPQERKDGSEAVSNVGMQPEVHVLINRHALLLSPGDDRLAAADYDYGVVVWERRRPEWWWGVAWLPEFWLTAVFTLALGRSLRRDWKVLRHARRTPSVPRA